MKTNLFGALIMSLLAICSLTSCDNDDDTSNLPITLVYTDRGEEITFHNHTYTIYLTVSNIESLQIKGGNGNYTLIDDNETVLDVKHDKNTMTLTPLSPGVATIKITDDSEIIYVLTVKSRRQGLSVKTIESIIEGDNITADEKIALEKEILASSPKGYYIKFNENDSKNGVVRVFSHESNNTEYKDYDFIMNPEDIPVSLHPIFNTQIYSWLLMTSGDEKMILFSTRNLGGTRSSPPIQYYILDVTANYKDKYPALERAYALQEHTWYIF